MHWGIRRTPEQLGHRKSSGLTRKQTKKNKAIAKTVTKTLGYGKWGEDAEHNVGYITGYAASGKTTIADAVAGKGDTVINLDYYMEPLNLYTDGDGSTSLTRVMAVANRNKSMNQDKNRKFTQYLDENCPGWIKMQLCQYDGSGPLKRGSKEWYELSERFHKAIEDYGAQEYKDGHKVVVEGSQIFSNQLTRNIDYFRDKPIFVMEMSVQESLERALKRAGDDPSIATAAGLQTERGKKWLDWYLPQYQDLYYFMIDSGLYSNKGTEEQPKWQFENRTHRID